jgi:hypothetical protein
MGVRTWLGELLLQIGLSLRSLVTGALGASVSRDWSGSGGGGDENDDMLTRWLLNSQDLWIEQQTKQIGSASG